MQSVIFFRFVLLFLFCFSDPKHIIGVPGSMTDRGTNDREGKILREAGGSIEVSLLLGPGSSNEAKQASIGGAGFPAEPARGWLGHLKCKQHVCVL